MKPTMTTTRQPEWGVSQAERDTCLHALGELYAARQLSLGELNARIDAALAADTDEALRALLDLDAVDQNDTHAPSGGEADAAPARSFNLTGLGIIAVASLAFVAVLVGAPLAVAAVAAIAVLVAASVMYMLLRAAVSRTTNVGATRLHAADVPPVQPPHQPTPRAVEDAESTPPPTTEPVRPGLPIGELVLFPVSQIPTQRGPLHVESVRMPIELGPEATALQLPCGSNDAATTPDADEVSVVHELASTAMLPALPGPAPTHAEDSLPDRTVQDEPVREEVPPSPEGDDVRSAISHLRPLLHRVTERAHGPQPVRTWRRSRASAEVIGDR